MQVDDEARLQPALDPVFQILDLARRAVGREDDLLVLVHQRVERVEKLFLSRILAGDELHIVDHQHVDGTKQVFEIHHLLFAQRLHEAIHELFGREIDHPQIGIAGLDVPGDGVHQVGLAQADTAIEKQRIERDRTALGHPARGGMGKLVGFADHEAVEGETPVKRRARQLVRLGLRP